jgi:multisubunit Na+/H+ antiporter MnhE subunit
MAAIANISWSYIFLGILAAAFVTFISLQLNLIDDKSELLYLNFGFYRHFLKIFATNFFSAIKLLIRLAFENGQLKTMIYELELSKQNQFSLALLIASFNMTTGLFCIGAANKKIFIHSLDKDYFQKVNLPKIYASLNCINEDNLV